MARDGKTHIFKGKTFTEAVAKAKTVLGNEISVVTRRDVREANLFSKLTQGKLGGDTLSVELEVAVSPPASSSPAPEKRVAPPKALQTYNKALEGAEKHSPAARQAMAESAARFLTVGETGNGIAGRLDELRDTVAAANVANADFRDEIRMLVSLQARGGVPAVAPALLECYRLLTDRDVDAELAREIVEGIQAEHPGLADPAAARAALRDAVARRIPVVGPVMMRESGPTVVALVGPSGVGKSTNVVKLAINYSMRQRKSVGIVNEDLRRPGAEAQLTNMARLFGLSVTTAEDPAGMETAVRSLAGRDVILIDTGGRSPRDAKGIGRLAEILRAAKVDETHLLLAGVGSEKTLRETEARYRPTGFDRLILTKLDECVSFGGVLNVASRLANGFSYVTTGSDYTRPIEEADSMMLADLVLGNAEVPVDAGGDAAEGSPI